MTTLFIVLIFSGLLFKRTYSPNLSKLPMISVIIAARNEQENIKNINNLILFITKNTLYIQVMMQMNYK